MKLKELSEAIDNGNTDFLEWVMFGDTHFPEVQKDLIIQSMGTPNGKALITAEMGIGKTYISFGLAQQIRLMYPGKKCLFSVDKAKVNEYLSGIAETVGAQALSVSGEADSVNYFMRHYDKFDFFVVQKSAWYHSLDFCLFLLNHTKDFSLAIYDESSAMSSIGYKIFSEFSRNVDHSFLTNANPVTSEPLQTFNNLRPIGAFEGDYVDFRHKYAKVNKKTRKPKLNVDKVKQDFSKYIVNANREDLDVVARVNVEFIRCEMTPAQYDWINKGMATNTAAYSPETWEGDSSVFQAKPVTISKMVPAIMETLELIKRLDRTSTEKKNRIIYVKNYIPKIKLKEELEKLGHPCFILDGKVTKTRDEQLLAAKKFNDSTNAIILTNIVRGINLGSAHEVIMCGLPPDSGFKQLIFRAIRGLNDKIVDLYIVYYPEFQTNLLAKILEALNNESKLLDRNNNLARRISDELRIYNPHK